MNQIFLNTLVKSRINSYDKLYDVVEKIKSKIDNDNETINLFAVEITIGSFSLEDISQTLKDLRDIRRRLEEDDNLLNVSYENKYYFSKDLKESVTIAVAIAIKEENNTLPIYDFIRSL